MKASRGLRIAAILLVLAAVQALLVFGYKHVAQRRRAAESPAFRYERLPERPSPELTLRRIDGSSSKLSAWRGKPLLLHFWATWCPPCREELPGILQLGRELAVEGRLQLVAVSMDADWAVVRDYFAGEVPPEVVLVEAASAARMYDLSTLPDTYLLSAEGTTRLRFGGARDWRSHLAREALIAHTAPR
jgi:thiol-disulfide isomerase/thioredoxin